MLRAMPLVLHTTTPRVTHSGQVSAEVPDEDKPSDSGQQQIDMMLLAEDHSRVTITAELPEWR